MAFSELPAALQSGVFEGQENLLANIYSSKLHELTPVLGSARWWNKLSAEDQAMIRDAMDAATWYNRGFS